MLVMKLGLVMLKEFNNKFYMKLVMGMAEVSIKFSKVTKLE